MYVSASKLNTFLTCPRKAVLEAMGFRRPYNDTFKRGHDLHLALERYLTGQTPIIDDPLAIYARAHLPMPNDPNIWVEIGLGKASDDAGRYSDTSVWTGMQDEVDGVPILGISDLVRMDRGMLEVWDHKTTSSFYYAETEDTLGGNLQLNLYADHFIRWLDYQGPVKLAHIQYLKSKRKTGPRPSDVRVVEVTLPHTTILMRGRVLRQMAQDYINLLREAQPVSIPREREGCSKYGGCHLLGVCDTMEEPDGHSKWPMRWHLTTNPII